MEQQVKYKIVILGEGNYAILFFVHLFLKSYFFFILGRVGKTSMLLRYCEDKYNEK